MLLEKFARSFCWLCLLWLYIYVFKEAEATMAEILFLIVVAILAILAGFIVAALIKKEMKDRGERGGK